MPIETVWDALSDHFGIGRWAPGLTVTMDKVGTTDPNGVGAIRRIASAGPGPDIVEEVVTSEPPHVLAYKALSGVPFPGYSGEVRLSEAGAGTQISYTLTSSARSPLVKAPLAAICQVLMRMLARAATKQN
ncbi:SRPBCC family protein [Mycobacterium sp. JS623]|uniref:SRPBCC family protein n=1 Tax=Mycobacterium sp. JS623 TaxID=212767 RepID=UPI00030EEA76|nr:SRPBCC family protein [Mycobacterium sp. JS623]